MRLTRTPAMLAAVLAGVLVASCASDDNTAAPASSTDTGAVETISSALTPPTTGAIDPGLQPYIDRSVTDLSGRLDVGVEDIVVVAAILVEWPDASLGCPQPDLQYAQVATDGSLITLAIDGDTYEYHAGGDTTPFLCETPPDKGPPVTLSAP